jgi:nucleoid-associated protein YgaU
MEANVDGQIAQSWRAIGPLAAVAALSCVAYLVAKVAGLLGQRLTSRVAWPIAPHRRLLFLGLTILWACSTEAPAAGTRSLPTHKPHAPKPPWSGSGGSPPPLPPVPTEGPASQGPRRSAHPAIHRRTLPGAEHGPLFPRASARPWDEPRTRSGSPSTGSGQEEPLLGQSQSPGRHRHEHSPGCCRHRYVVRSGDTLWGIAATVLGTDDPRRIARYWPRIHRANRSVVGPNPDLIRPGQILDLPEEPGS